MAAALSQGRDAEAAAKEADASLAQYEQRFKAEEDEEIRKVRERRARNRAQYIESMKRMGPPHDDEGEDDDGEVIYP